jgi:hypothetical protein
MAFTFNAGTYSSFSCCESAIPPTRLNFKTRRGSDIPNGGSAVFIRDSASRVSVPYEAFGHPSSGFGGPYPAFGLPHGFPYGIPPFLTRVGTVLIRRAPPRGKEGPNSSRHIPPLSKEFVLE